MIAGRSAHYPTQPEVPVSSTRPAASAAADEPAGKIPWRSIHKINMWISLVVALVLAVIMTLTLDVLVGLTHYHGAGRIALTVLFGIACFIANAIGVYLGIWMLVFGGMICAVAWFTITGGNHKTKASAAVQVATRRPDNKA